MRPEQQILDFGYEAALEVVRQKPVNIIKTKCDKNVENDKVATECKWAEAKTMIKD